MKSSDKNNFIEKKGSSEKISDNTNVEKNDSLQIEQWGLNYIEKKKFYLLISAIFPIYILFIEILTISLYSRSIIINPIHMLRLLFYFLTKGFGTLFILVFSFYQWHFLYNWRKKIKLYHFEIESLYRKIDQTIEDPENINHIQERKTSFPRLFYDIVNHMDKNRSYFLVFNFIAFFILLYNFKTFWFRFIPIRTDKMIFLIIGWLNRISALFLIFYICFQWYHFIKWNQKFSRLRILEKKIYDELDFEI